MVWALHIGKLISLYLASSLFGTQQQLTHPLVKSSTLPLRKMPIFRALHLSTQVSLYSASSLFGTQKQLAHPSIKCSFLPLWKNNVSQGSLLYNVFKLSCLGSLWFGTHPYYYSIHIYIYTICGLFLQQKTATIENILLFVWSISIVKDRRFADQCRPRL